MEIKVNIPKNNYQKPTQVREHIVQAICDYLLRVRVWREENIYYCYDNIKNKIVTNEKLYKDSSTEKPNECEMQCAFDCLIKAGYNIFGLHNISRGDVYYISEKDYYKDEWITLKNKTTKFSTKID